jgi:dipeptidyl aminopeptidase/acylaminoacyl peptidase
MGGWTALLTALNEPRVKGVAIIGAVCDPTKIRFSDDEIEAEFTPWLHGITIPQFHEQWASLRGRYVPTQQVRQLAQPLLVIHAKQDEVVWVGQAHSLMENAPSGTIYHEHPTANHSFTRHRKWLWTTLRDWLQDLD